MRHAGLDLDHLTGVVMERYIFEKRWPAADQIDVASI
jgi:hypothetical protein